MSAFDPKQTFKPYGMTLSECIRRAEQLLSGEAAPDDPDPRWQAIIDVSEFIESEPEGVWDFARRWGSHPDPDLRDAIATCLIEHLLQHHFDLILPKIEQALRVDPDFADTVSRCWAYGQAESPPNAKRFARMKKHANQLARSRKDAKRSSD